MRRSARRRGKASRLRRARPIADSGWAARSFKPLTEPQVAALLAKTALAAEAGKFELYKTSHHFDGTFENPQWLG